MSECSLILLYSLMNLESLAWYLLVCVTVVPAKSY